VPVGAGPLFWRSAATSRRASAGGLLAVLKVRQVALTPTLRRRLTYLGATFLAPGMAVFPYLVIAGAYRVLPSDVVLLFSALGNAGVALMITVMVYSIAFQGMLLPDRLIKQDFIRWGLYGPFVGVTIILFLRGVPVLARWMGLPQETLLTFGVMIFTVLMPLFVRKIKPYLDALIYRQDHAEIDYLRALPRNTFTYADLRSLLENTLVVICGALRVDTGFVAAPDEQDNYTIKTLVGPRRAVKRFVAEHPLAEIMVRLRATPAVEPGKTPPVDAFLRYDSFCMLPLRDPEGYVLGALGVAYPQNALTPEARRLIGALAHQMEMALATVQMQQRVFDTLRGMGPEMQLLQELNTRLEQATPASLDTLETEIALLPEFPQLVKDALSHYWGGPKLANSPLLRLQVVRQTLQSDNNPARAMRAVLDEAMARLKPEGQPSLSSVDWTLYNILEMKFVKGQRTRDIASRLAMSESDLYRKQRVAIEQVAQQIATMEAAEKDAPPGNGSGIGDRPRSGTDW